MIDGASASLDVNGSASPNGAVYFVFSAVPSIGQTYTFLSANAIVSTFRDFDSNMAGVVGTFVYGAGAPQTASFEVTALDDVFHGSFDSVPEAVASPCAAAFVN